MTLLAEFPRVIDNTMRSDFVACPHRFFRRHILGLRRDAPSVHLHFGGCYASALETARKEFFSTGDSRDSVILACETAIERWGNFEMPGDANMNERKKSLQALLLAVQDYFREWPLDEDDLTIHSFDGITPAVEFSFAVPIPGSRHPDTGEPILYAGRFDMIGNRRGKLWGLDDKTTGSLGERWRKQWRLRAQFTGYVWGSREWGVNLDGFLIRGCAPMKESTQFDEALATRPHWMVEQWLRQLKVDVNMMISMYLAHKDIEVLKSRRNAWAGPHPFAQNFDSACSDYNGCTYLDLCTSENPEPWAESEYVVDRWNPLTRGSDA